MKAVFTKASGEVVEENYDSFTVKSSVNGEEHELVLANEGDADHKHRLRLVTSKEGANAGSPRYVKAELEDGHVFSAEENVVPLVEAESDGVLTDEEIDALSHDDLATALEKRGVEVPKTKKERAAALRAFTKEYVDKVEV